MILGYLMDARQKTEHPKPLQLDGKLSAEVRRGFGLNPADLHLSESPEVRAMGARALAKGNVIQFAPGEFSPGTPEGLETLGHELAHVRSQAMGEVPMTGGVLEHPGHEAAADRAGEAFANGSLMAAAPVSAGALSGQNAPTQCRMGGIGSWMSKHLTTKKGREKKELKRDIAMLQLGENPFADEDMGDMSPEDAALHQTASANQRMIEQMELEEKQNRLAELSRPSKFSRFFKGIGKRIGRFGRGPGSNRPQAPASLGAGPADPRIANMLENPGDYPLF